LSYFLAGSHSAHPEDNHLVRHTTSNYICCMAIEDGPRANHLHWQETYGPVLSRYRQAVETQKSAIALLKQQEYDYITAQETQNKDLAEINQAIKDLSTKVGMIVPVSVYPSLIIDDPDHPPPNPAAADDIWQTISDALSPAEQRELLRDQTELQRLRKKREGVLFRITQTETELPPRIEEAKEFLHKSSIELQDAGEEYDKHKDAIEGSAFSSTTVALKGVEAKGEVASAKQIHEASASVTVGFDASAKGFVIPPEAQKEIASAKQLAEVADKIAADERNRRLDADAKLKAMEAAYQVLQAEAAMPAEQVIENDHLLGLKLKSEIIELKVHDGDSPAMIEDKQHLNRLQPVGKTLEVVFEEPKIGRKKDTHVRRSIAVRAGADIRGQRTMLTVLSHHKMNLYKVVFQEGGKVAYVGLGKGRKNPSKTVIKHCRSQYFDKGWTEDWESNVPDMPADYLANVNYKPERLLGFHRLAMTAWSQKVTTEAIVNPIVDDVISIATNGEVP